MAGETEKVAELEGQVTNLEATVTSLTKKLEKATEDNPTAAQAAEVIDQLDQATKALEETSNALEELTAKNEELEAIAAMSPSQKAWYDNLKDDKKKKDFKDMKSEEKDEEVKKGMAADESVVIEGQTIQKSAVGESSFAIFKAQAARITKNEADLATERTARETVTLEKRADDEFPHVPGTTQERGKMLGAIDKMDEPVKKAFLAVFTQSEALAKKTFDKIGSGDGGKTPLDPSIKKATTDFNSKVADIRKRDNCSRSVALSKARNEYPDLFKAYQGEGAEAN